MPHSAEVAIYLEAMRREGAGWVDVDVCPDHSARRDGFVVNRSGSGPAVVYLPGFHSDDLVFYRARPGLSRAFTVYSVFYRRAGAHTPGQYAADVAEAMERLGVERAGLIGESMGSLPSLTLALERPGLVGALALAGGFTRHVSGALTGAGRLALGVVPPRLLQASIRHLLPLTMLRRVRDPALSRGLIDAMARLRTARHLRAGRERLAMIAAWDCRDRLDALKCPIYYLGGARDELVRVKEEIGILERISGGCESYLVPRGMHAVLVLRPDLSVEKLTPFFSKHLPT